MGFIGGHLFHHGRFYASAGFGLVVFAIAVLLGWPVPLSAACDAFFAAYLLASGYILATSATSHVKTCALTEDEGALIVVAIALVAVGANVVGIFTALNAHDRPDALTLSVALAAAPLGWFVLHTISAFHYANLHYFDPHGGKAGKALQFPGTNEPDLWDFFYFSYVIGMTFQVSDVQIRARDMRRAVIGHSIVSFFFNTVLIAMAVNAAVARSG